MIANRSVPVDTLLPHIFYRDLAAAIDWLTKTLGFAEHYRYGDPLSGAQMHLGDAWIMVQSTRADRAAPAQLGAYTQSLTIFVEDVESHFQHTKSSGATIIEELNETVYGELQYGALDLDGHLWLFSRHARDLSPEQWGATLAPANSRHRN
ncbi:VOC family protein [Tunturiibacter gelidoferens]|uniref:Putative glyoxalase superfamily protein PhnB n=1 Tax=Tunturiibacter lichenicola TaxID=2051959 RepID=A0A7Y9NNT9_9BACT|nr:VOC family protein [Edaphobacter lichenicola]NYF52810.1 putative glyoxalase superfamily protein PhnB [Edaphobacter lichenicola]